MNSLQILISSLLFGTLSVVTQASKVQDPSSGVRNLRPQDNMLPMLYDSVEGPNLKDTSYGCVCTNYTCGCCAHIEAPRVGLNDTGCVNLTYLPKEYGISFTVTIDTHTIYNETISARNPPPVCFGAPILKAYADLCVHFYDIDISRTKMHGCAQLEARLHKVVVGKYELGCFNFGNLRWKEYHVKLIEQIMARRFLNKH